MAASASKGGSWMDTILNLIPGRRAAASSEPSEDAIKRTHDNLRCLTLPLREELSVLGRYARTITLLHAPTTM